MNKLSIIIVNHNSEEYLRNCLKSIFQKLKDVNFEVFVVDNGSTNGSLKMIKDEFPQTNVISNKENIGFARANNQALKKIKGEYVLLLNPDTIILDEKFEELVKFMEKHPEAGACGPKVLNPDNSIQHQCKRGFPSPLNSLAYFLKLDKIFPKSRLFGGYLLTYLDPNKIQEVDSLSGACMMVRSKIIKQVGYIDERYYLYGDDLDWCYRIKKAGWKIYYIPKTRIIHFGGKGGAEKRPYKSLYHFYRSAFLFYRKHLSKHYLFFINWLVYLGIFLKFIVTLLINNLKRERTVGSKKP